jgi:hypothetical protein
MEAAYGGGQGPEGGCSAIDGWMDGCPTCRNHGTSFHIALVQVITSAKDCTVLSKILIKCHSFRKVTLS